MTTEGGKQEPVSDDGPVQRCYELRLVSNHDGDENEMVGVDLELRRTGEDWEPFELSVHSSPFLNFLHSALLCQLAFVRMNCTELGLRLNHVHGLCECDTTDFIVDRFVASFAIDLADGEADADDLAYLRERCLACPVSRNLKHVGAKDSVVTMGTEPSRSLFDVT